MAAEFMTGAQLRDARAALGEAWGLGRPLKMAEMARACGLGGRDPGATVRDYEDGKTKISGPLSKLVRAYLNGYRPPEGVEAAIAPNVDG